MSNNQLQIQHQARDRVFVQAIRGFLPVFADVVGVYMVRCEIKRPHEKRGIPVDIKIENLGEGRYLLSYFTRSEMVTYRIEGDVVKEDAHTVNHDLLNERLCLDERMEFLVRLVTDVAVYAIKAKQGHPK